MQNVAQSTCCGCPESQATSGILCRTRMKIIIGVVSSITATTLAYVSDSINYMKQAFGISASSPTKAEEEYSYINYYKNHDEIEINSHCITGSSKDELFILPKQEMYAFGKGGKDVFILKDAPDNLFFSKCSTKIIDGKVATIYNFDSKEDKIYFFCSKQKLNPDNISTWHNTPQNVTYIEVTGDFEKTAIAIVGNHPNLEENIILNQNYDSVSEETCSLPLMGDLTSASHLPHGEQLYN